MRNNFGDRLARLSGRIISPRRMTARQARPIISFSFDDFPRTAATEGAAVLREQGIKATYFASGGLAGREFEGQEMFRREDLEALAEEGHEIGCHSFDHVSSLRRSGADYADSLARNRQYVSETLGDVRLSSFAYPYGDASPAAKRIAMKSYAVARGVDAGLNGAILDLAQLKAVGLESGRMNAGAFSPLLERAVREKSWLIVFTHDVRDRPSPFGTTQQELAALAQMALKGGLTPLTIKAALADRVFAELAA